MAGFGCPPRLDDAIWLLDFSDANRPYGWLKRPQETGEISRLTDLIIAGKASLLRSTDDRTADSGGLNPSQDPLKTRTTSWESITSDSMPSVHGLS